MTWFEETLHQRWRQRFAVTREVYRGRTGLQEVVIFETQDFGRVLALDGVIQTTERDEYVYHESLAHVPILGHGAVRQVLIIGGGDGGCLREVLKHPLERATMVEIDRSVIDLCREHMPGLSAGAFADARAELVIADGVRFVAETERRYDVIIVDSTDPIGPGEVLFTRQFYADCRRCLAPGGILVTQNGVPFMQGAELTRSHRWFKELFADATCYLAAVPSYMGGVMALGWADRDGGHRPFDREVLEQRYRAAAIDTRHYSPEVHIAAFALAPAVRALLA